MSEVPFHSTGLTQTPIALYDLAKSMAWAWIYCGCGVGSIPSSTFEIAQIAASAINMNVSTRLSLTQVRKQRIIMKATWNGQIIAQSKDTVIIEGNHYFPADSIKSEFFKDSATQSACPWKGTASYKTLTVDGKENTDAAWFYPATKDMAKAIKGHFAFWKGVEVTD